jgi:hypothetical protein
MNECSVLLHSYTLKMIELQSGTRVAKSIKKSSVDKVNVDTTIKTKAV